MNKERNTPAKPTIHDDIDCVLQLARDELNHLKQDGEHDKDSGDDYRDSKAALKRMENVLRANQEHLKSLREKEFAIVNDLDGNDSFLVKARDGNDAAHKALKELGWWVAETTENREEG